MKYRRLTAIMMAVCIFAGSPSAVCFAETVQESVPGVEEKSGETDAEKAAEDKPAEDKNDVVKPKEEKPAEEKKEEESSEETQKKAAENSEEKPEAENHGQVEAQKAPVKKDDGSENESLHEETVNSGTDNKNVISEDSRGTQEDENGSGSEAEAKDAEQAENPEQDAENSQINENDGDSTVEEPETTVDEIASEEGYPEESTGEMQKPQDDDTGEPDITDNPDDERTEDNADALSVKISADRKYAFVNTDQVKFKAVVSGGKAPYAVEFHAKGASSKSKNLVLEQPDKCIFKCTPESFGTLTVSVKITDADGNTISAKTKIEAPVVIREKTEKWEAELEDIELTGNWNRDIVSVAVSQLGYEESSRNFIITDDGKKMGYTRYGDWFGRDYNDWCGIFVCFCMHYAGIPEEEYPRESISNNWKKAIAGIDAFESAGDYVPRSGDLVFFNIDDDSGIDHMSIVEFADDDEIHTIEGNSGKRVVRKCYDSDNTSIVGYANTGKIMEESGGDMVEKEKKTPPKRAGYEGFTAGTMVNVRQTPDADGNWLACIPEKDTKVKVLAAEFSGTQVWYKVRYNGIEGYILSTLLDVDGYTELIGAE